MPSTWRKKRRFVNPHVRASRRNLWHVLLWQFGYYDEVSSVFEVPADFEYPNPDHSHDPSEPAVTWINHTTFLVQLEGVTILTDPIWSERCSPIKFIGPRRLHPPPMALEALPRVDYVLISHDHYDHLDRTTVLALVDAHPEITWMVPLGVGRWLREWGIQKVIELDWWQAFECGGFEFTAVPAQHFSGRTLLDANTSLWCGWVVRSAFGQQRRFYFVGDTGYNRTDFKQIGDRLGSFDLCLVPIGAYLPREFMGPVHASPADAVEIHLDCRSRLSVASHWGTFCLSSEERKQPPYDLYLSLLEKGLQPHAFRVLSPGQTINW